MKISELLGEDDAMKIKAVSGNDVTIDQGGQEIKTTADALVPSADKPGSFTMKAPDPNQMKPGAEVTSTSTTSEDVGGDPTDEFINDVTDHEYGVHEEGDQEKSFTMPLADFLAGVDQTAKENGLTGIDPAQFKPMLVLTPNGEVDALPTLKKIAGYFQGPEFTKFVDDMRKLLAFAQQNRPGPTQTAAAGNAPYNPMNNPQAKLGTGTFDNGDDLTRIQEAAELDRWLTIAGLK